MRYIARLLLTCLALLIASSAIIPKSYAQSVVVSSPEDSRVRCVTADTCPLPILGTGQDPRCVKAACVSNVCTTKILVGAPLGLEAPGTLSCYLQPIVCSRSGAAVADTTPSKRVARNEGQTCSSSLPVASCSIARCRNAECKVENDDGAACSNASLTVCQKGVCQGGLCSAGADPTKAGVECAPSKTTGCKSTVYRCSSLGVCGAQDVVADGKECAPNIGYNSTTTFLPASFKASFVGGAPTGAYSCTSACKLEYCGDSTVQTSLGEQCDNSTTTKANTVCSNCKITCAPGTTTDPYGTCCADTQKDASKTCCPAWKTPGCGSCDGCKNCPTARCRFGGQFGWPMAHLGPGCAPSSNWHVPSVSCGACRLDFGHGQTFWKIGLYSNSNVVGAQSCFGRTDVANCSDAGKSGWIYSTNPAGELITSVEEQSKVPCECNNGTITCNPSNPYPPRCLHVPVHLWHRYDISQSFGTGSNDSVGVLYSHNEIYEVCRGALGAASVSDVVPYDGVPWNFDSSKNNLICKFAPGSTSQRTCPNANSIGNPAHIAQIKCRCK